MSSKAVPSAVEDGSMQIRCLAGIALAAAGLFFLTGCYSDPLDPTQIGRFEPTPAVNVILDTLGVADEPTPTYEGAEPPRPEDLIKRDTDYVFGPGDVVRINIYELLLPGQSFVNDYVVTETGRVSIPDAGLVRAAGLTEAQLEQEIRDILSPTILKDPSVSVSLVQSQSQIFSIVGQGVGQSSRFRIPRYTFRLTDAIALAGGVAEFNVSHIYVSREVSAEEAATYRPVDFVDQPDRPHRPYDVDTRPVQPPAPHEPAITPEEELLDIIAPGVVSASSGGLTIGSSEMSRRRELERLATPESIASRPVADRPLDTWSAPVRQMAETNSPIEWVFEDGRWIPKTPEDVDRDPDQPPTDIRREDVEPDRPPIRLDRAPDDRPFDIADIETVTRVIQIPVDRLLAGDPQYNIVIRPGDRITVPVDLLGEFWVMGNVNFQGAIPITGRPITLKQAIASAGGLGPLAYPKKVEVVRRLGRNSAGLMQEETVLVDLEKIARGQQPDFFIKPNDLINVGTHGTSRWQAVLRNAFRATYGFGFIYDRNFADRHFGRTIPDTLPF